MNDKEIIMDLTDTLMFQLHRVLDDLAPEAMTWQPDPEANNIAVTVWHMGRLFDVFLTRQINDDVAENECWFSRGWAHKTGYDPRGIGRDGWGSVNGYTAEEVAAIPRFTGEQLLAYFDDVHDTVRTYLRNTPIDELQTAASGFDRRYTRYQCIQMALLDNVRHLGEIFSLQAMWDRRNGVT